MQRAWLLRCAALAAFLLINSCSTLKQSEDPNYSLCKQLQGQIQFGGNTSYNRTAQSENSDKRRLKATYDKMDCQKYQWLSI